MQHSSKQPVIPPLSRTASHPEAGGVPFVYDWRSKAEPLLWIADAIAGAVGEHVSGKDDQWFARLDAAGVITLMFR